MTAARRLRWLELTPDYRCNNRCVGCWSVQDDGPSMTGAEALAALRQGRSEGVTALWIGGGEPTLRKDLFALASLARRLGYARVKLQTNGMMLAYEGFARRCVEAGVTEVAFSMKGADAATHDRLARTDGCFALLVQGVERAREAGLALEGDVLAMASNVAQIPAMVALGAGWGFARFRVWMLSAVDGAQDLAAVQAEVPRIEDVAAGVAAAREAHAGRPDDFVVSLHTPACVLPPEHLAAAFDARAFGMRVVNPGGHAFDLADSPMEGGTFLPACAGCRHRSRCGGLRRDYLAVHGGGAFHAVA